MEGPYRPTLRASCPALVAVMVACVPMACSADSGGDDEGEGIRRGESTAETTAVIPPGLTGETTDSAVRDAPPGTGPPEQSMEIPAFRDHDRDGNGALDGDEFAGWVEQEGVHASWVYEAQGDLDVERVGERMLVVWDADRDSLLTEEEWGVGVGAWFGDQDHGVFPDWDVDGDGAVRAPDVTESLDRRGVFDGIDLDGDTFLNDVELARWLFTVVDTGGDGRLDVAEWEAAVEAGWVG